MELSENVIIAILTFIFFIVIAVIFKKPITNAKKVKISLTGIEFEASGDEFAHLFEKTYSNVLKKEHIEFFCNLFRFQHTPIVKEVLPDFDRDSDDWKKSDKGKQTEVREHPRSTSSTTAPALLYHLHPCRRHIV